MRQVGAHIPSYFAALCALVTVSADAFAQDDEEEYVDDAPEVPMGDPLEEDYGTGVAVDDRRHATYRRATEPEERSPFVIAAEGGVPIWIDTPALDPGVDAAVRVGYDFGGLAPDVTFGFMSNRVNEQVVLVAPAAVGRDLQHLQLGLGVRGLWENRTRFRPFASVGFDFNFWTWTGHSSIRCSGDYYCAESQSYDLAPGINLRLGLLTQLVGALHLEAGGKFHVTFEGALFDRSRFWIGPYLGVVFQ